MSQTLPPSRLTDVLRQNSINTLKRHAAELAAASSMLPAEAMETRFLRNHFLVNPKSLHLLTDELTLSRYHFFAIYKPPFCPMRRADARENYHKVSVESFVAAALKSQMVLPVMTRTLAPKDVHIRVLNDVDTFASGPVIVSVADKYPHATSLDRATFQYDVLVAGHIQQTTMGGGGGPKPIPVEALFPEVPAASEGGPATAATASCECTFEVVQHCYYSVHPVSLLNIKITSPPSPLPPNIEAFVRSTLDTCVVGDPVAMGKFMDAAAAAQDQQQQQCSAGAPGGGDAAHMKGSRLEEARTPQMRSHVVSMRGDCDFPRVFTHLREVHFPVELHDVSGDSIGKRTVEFNCRKCFDSVLQKSRNYSLKGYRISLLDGSWTPASEFV